MKKTYQDCIEYRNEAELLHRIDGSAIELSNGTKFLYLHRLDGPAIERANGHKVWYLDGKQIDCNSQEQFEKLMNLRTFW